VEREPAARAPELARKERERAIDEERTEIRFVADKKLLAKIKHARDLCSHRLKDPTSYAELLEVLADVAIQKLDPRMKRERTASRSKSGPAKPALFPTPKVATAPLLAPVAPAPAKPAAHASRYIPAQVRREVWREANGRCTYRDPATGKLCDSTFKLQIEHLDPYAMGGSSRDPANLTLLCVAHNQMKAERAFGGRKPA
jgi:hypothetical protein